MNQLVVGGGVEPPASRFSVGRSSNLSYPTRGLAPPLGATGPNPSRARTVPEPAHTRGSRHLAVPTPAGTVRGMATTGTRVAALSGRAAFAVLRAAARRGRSATVTVLAAPDPSLDRAEVAYAIRARAGTAVARNRLRRRARALLEEWAANGRLAPGRYLVSFAPPLERLEGPALAAHLAAALGRATGN